MASKPKYELKPHAKVEENKKKVAEMQAKLDVKLKELRIKEEELDKVK